MTANNGWPGKPGVPLNPEKDGWHWAKIIHGISQPRPRLWWSKIDRWELSDGALISPSEFAERWRYLAPCLAPDEVQNLHDDLAGAERERAHQQSRADRNAAEYAREQARREALQARCEEAERERDALRRDASQEIATDELVRRLQHLGDWQAADRIEALQKRVAVLEGALKDAAAAVKEWGAYASQYLQDKWDLPGEVARYIAIAEGKNDAALEGKKDE